MDSQLLSRKRCFVIMPFSQTTEEHDKRYWTTFFKKYIKTSVEALGYECYRSSARPTEIIKGIIEELNTSDIVLAVLTDKNPNVWYELGIRHSLRHGTIMIIEKGERIPSDISHFGVIKYDRNKRMNFQNELNEFIKSIEAVEDYDSPVISHFASSATQLAKTSTSVVNSPLTFGEVLDRAQENVLIVGQNLSSIATDERHKRKLFEILKTKEIDIQLLLCDPKTDYVVRATKEFTADIFDIHLEESVTQFKKWNREIEAERNSFKGNFLVKGTNKIGNISLTFLDPRKMCGELLITPVPWQMGATVKPCFWISKMENKGSFESYWSTYETIWRNFSRNMFEDISPNL